MEDLAGGEEWKEAPQREPLRGDESFVGLDAFVSDFWAFAMSDLRMNNVRGYLAEFLVREAVLATHTRIEWAEADITTPAGVTIEVKSSAYLQAWAQRRNSRIVFTGLRGRTWTPAGGYHEQATYNAAVYVFALQTAEKHEDYDPLDVNQWAFWVLSASALAALDIGSVSLGRVEQLTARLAYADLAEAIRIAADPGSAITGEEQTRPNRS